MPDNTTLNTGSGGDPIVTREISHSGDTAKLQGMFLMGITGTEGSYTAAAVNGDATNGIDADVTRVIPGTDATHLGKAEDAAHASGDTGVAMLAVRRDSAAVGSGTDGDYSTLNVDATGQLRTVNESGNTSLAVIDDWDESDRAKVNIIAGQAGITAGAGAVGASTPRTTLASDDPAVVALQIIDDWDESDRAKTNPIVGQAGVAAGAGAVGATVQRVTLASDDPAVTALQIIDDWDNAASDGASVSGDVAHDDADAGEPVKQGFKATTALSGITLVANNDRTNGYAGVDGVQIIRPTTGLEDIVRGNANNTDGSSTQVIAASGSASVKTYLTDVTLTNTSSSMIYVELKSGTTVMYTCPVPATGGFTKTFNPPLPPNAANEAWNFDASAATTTLYCSAIGFKSKV